MRDEKDRNHENGGLESARRGELENTSFAPLLVKIPFQIVLPGNGQNLWRVVTAGGIQCKSSTAHTAEVMPRMEDTVAPMRARSAKMSASAFATVAGLVHAAWDTRARSLEPHWALVYMGTSAWDGALVRRTGLIHARHLSPAVCEVRE